MKSFFTALLLFALTLVAAVGNYHYINSVADYLHEVAEDLPPPDDVACVKAIAELDATWQSHAPRIGLTVEFRTLDRISEQITLLQECASHGDVFGYYNAFALLQDALEDMRRLECLSISNLL